MTRSIFDPTGRETERSGSTFQPEQAGNRSHMPPDVTDGDVIDDPDDIETGIVAEAETKPGQPVENRKTDPDAGLPSEA